jgi:hypothetical protein
LRGRRRGKAGERSEAMRLRIAEQVGKLNQDDERRALLWIEAVSEFDEFAD